MRRKATRDLGTALRLCVTEHDWRVTPDGLAALLHDERDLAELVRAAFRHGVENFVYLSVRGVVPPDSPPLRTLRELHQRSMAMHLAAITDLATAASTLQTAGIPWLAFKGPVLAEHQYGSPELRRYLDLDLLVDRNRRADAVAALVALGGAIVGEDLATADDAELGQVHVTMPVGTVVDLHWELVNRPEMRRSVRVDAREFLARRRAVSVAGAAVPTFDAVDTVLHLAMHAALAGGFRLLWLKDVERAVVDPEVDWRVLVDRARVSRIAVPVGAILERSWRLLGAAVPGEVIDELRTSPVDRLTPVLDRIWPPETSGPRTPPFVWTQFRRDRAATTAALVARRAAWAARRRIRPAGQ